MPAPGSPVLAVVPLEFVWATLDPFLFCVHHEDFYPAGNEKMGPPPETLRGRNIGMDFQVRDGWRMYHGDVVPGFPRHPHRGFETITLARRGFIDHSDSLGATARFGEGDVQWMTAGEGIVHSEMFPLRQRDKDNPCELFQIWINLPKASKMVKPYFSMFWEHEIPSAVHEDAKGLETGLRIIAGPVPQGLKTEHSAPPTPPPDSWAADPRSDVAIWTIDMDADATWELPPGPAGANRVLYVYEGDGIEVADETVRPTQGAQLKADAAVSLKNKGKRTRMLMLQGRPIGEPVVQHGPFVMNTKQEIEQAFIDYRRTQFGGWPWKRDDPVHEREQGRFAKHADGRVEKPA